MGKYGEAISTLEQIQGGNRELYMKARNWINITDADNFLSKKPVE
jgi:hypothetical protein